MKNTIIGFIGGFLIMGCIWAWLFPPNHEWCRNTQLRYQMPSGVIVALPPAMSRNATDLCYGTWDECGHRIEKDGGNFSWLRAPYSDAR